MWVQVPSLAPLVEQKRPCKAGHFLFDAKGFGLRRGTACPQLFSRRVFRFAVEDRGFASRNPQKQRRVDLSWDKWLLSKKSFLVTSSHIFRLEIGFLKPIPRFSFSLKQPSVHYSVKLSIAVRRLSFSCRRSQAPMR